MDIKKLVSGLVASTAIVSANAAPTVIPYASIDALTTDDFQSYPLGRTERSSFIGFSVAFMAGGYGIANCESSGKCLQIFDGPPSDDERRLFDFDSGTTQVGFVLDSGWSRGLNLPDTFVIRVVGISGMLTLNRTLGEDREWFAFNDEAGLIEIYVTNYGSSTSMYNYAFDDVITSAVPEPRPGILLAGGMLGLFALCRRFRVPPHGKQLPRPS